MINMQERLYKTCMAFCIIVALFVQKKVYTKSCDCIGSYLSMENILWPRRLDFISAAEKIEVINLLERKKDNCSDMEYRNKCDFYLDAVRDGLLFYYDEIRDFLGLNNNPVSANVSVEVEHILEMFAHISLSLSKLPLKTADLIGRNYYTRFSGFENADEQHLSHYIFLFKHKQHSQAIFNEKLPLTLKHYRNMLARYERHKLCTFLTEEMLIYICIGRNQQIKFTL